MFDFLNNREVSNTFRDYAIPLTFCFCFFFGLVMIKIRPRNALDWCWTWVMWSFVSVLFAAIYRTNVGYPLMPIFEIAIWLNIIVCLIVTFIVYVKWQYANREF
jgi:hypothetical protein